MQKFYVKIVEQYHECNGVLKNIKIRTLCSYDIQQKDIKEIEAFLIKSNMKKSSGNPKKPVRCIETGMIFDTKQSACIWLHKYSSGAVQSIGAVCKGKKDTAYGYHWEYV